MYACQDQVVLRREQCGVRSSVLESIVSTLMGDSTSSSWTGSVWAGSGWSTSGDSTWPSPPEQQRGLQRLRESEGPPAGQSSPAAEQIPTIRVADSSGHASAPVPCVAQTDPPVSADGTIQHAWHDSLPQAAAPAVVPEVAAAPATPLEVPVTAAPAAPALEQVPAAPSQPVPNQAAPAPAASAAEVPPSGPRTNDYKDYRLQSASDDWRSAGNSAAGGDVADLGKGKGDKKGKYGSYAKGKGKGKEKGKGPSWHDPPACDPSGYLRHDMRNEFGN